MIPKIIHYCWFGPRKFSDLERSCIESWRKVLPEYSIKCWSEESFDVNSYEFTKEAYRLGKFAFVSDVCRFFALFEEGGVYLDTDMMVIKTFDNLLSNDFFIGEQKEGDLNAAIIGATPRNPIAQKLLKGYMSVNFDYLMPLDIPTYLNQSLDRESVKVYPKEYFYPLPYATRGDDFRDYIRNETYSVHLWNHTWKQEWDYLHDKNFKMALRKYFKRLASAPQTVFKDTFPLDFVKYLLAAKFEYIYRIYKKES